MLDLQACLQTQKFQVRRSGGRGGENVFWKEFKQSNMW